VLKGYAQVATYPPDVKYEERFVQAQHEAVEAGSGLWGAACQLTPTAVPTAPTPAGSCPQGCEIPPEGCVIKGNISKSSGDRIYHVPGENTYEDTVINPAAGERWFCTAQEAEDNGWRKPRG
jgi:hypothetical protein